jgi:hypothetical protein
MNLSAKTLRQLAMLAVALFFFSCEDETSILGFKNPNEKFNVSYIEIPVESSVLLFDSIRTSNWYITNNALVKDLQQNLLVGKYTDDKFGEVTASAFTQFMTSNSSKTLLKGSSQLDSVSLKLHLFVYTYGSTGLSSQTISIHELDTELKNPSYYYNSTNTAIIPTVLGSKSFSIDPALLKKDTAVISIPLDNSFGQRIFDVALRYSTSTSYADSAFVHYSDFVKEFKGLAILADQADKVVSLSLSSAIVLHYHDEEADSLSLRLPFENGIGLTGYTKITSTRGGTELAGLTQPYQDFTSTDSRFIQSGVGIFTKLNFEKFFEFADTIPNLIINSAELIINDVEQSSFAPPDKLALRVLKDNNRLKGYSVLNEQDSKDLRLYKGSLTSDIVIQNVQNTLIQLDSVLYVKSDFVRKEGAAPGDLLIYDKDSKSYNGFATMFFQQLFYRDEERTRFKNFVLYPTSPSANKSLNRAVFHKNSIKLRIKYTKPTQLNP